MNTACGCSEQVVPEHHVPIFGPQRGTQAEGWSKKFLRMLITSSWSNNPLVDYLLYILKSMENLIILQLYLKKQELHIKNGKNTNPSNLNIKKSSCQDTWSSEP